MKKKTEKFVTVSGVVRRSDYESLKKLCGEQGITVNRFVGDCVYQVLAKQREVKGDPLLDRINELSLKVGSLIDSIDSFKKERGLNALTSFLAKLIRKRS